MTPKINSSSSLSTLCRKLHFPRSILAHTRTFRIPATTMTRGVVVCVAHGGGPMPVLGDPGHASITASLKTRVPKILKL
ncbi:hypothetical protein CH063_05289, partial [Colletotrichum higginsianum]